MLLAAALLVLLPCLRAGHAGRSLAQPLQVRFAAEILHHVLCWEPAPGGSPEVRYDVQYRQYGGNHSWTPVLNCTRVASRSCDLTVETWDPGQRYYARVRAVAGSRISGWSRSPRFTPKAAILKVSSMQLSLVGNTVQVALELPTHKKNKTTAYEGLYPPWLAYRVRVRRLPSNLTQMIIETSLNFDLPPLLWGERYCISVEPWVKSWPNVTQRSEEQCISIPPLEDSSWRMVLLILSLAALGLGTLVVALACAYVKKPRKSPPVLSSLLKRSWALHEQSSLGTGDEALGLEVDPIQRLSLGLDGCADTASIGHSTGASPPPPLLERSCWVAMLLAEGRAQGPGLRDLKDSSGCSTDSGICLQDTSGSLVHLSCRKPSLGSEEEGGGQEGAVGLPPEEQRLPASPASSRTEQLAVGFEERTPPLDPPQEHFSGYQKQLGGPVEMVTFSGPSPRGPALAPGYLKQPAMAAGSGLEDRPLTKDLLAIEEQGGLHFPGSGPLDVLGPLGLLPEFPKVLLALGFSEPAPPSPSAHHSLLHSGAQLGLDLGVPNLPWCRV